MIALAPKHRIAFVGVPKCGTTSMAHALYQLQTGTAFDRQAVGKRVHRYHRDLCRDRNIRIEPPDMTALCGYWTCTLVRDPIQRLLSCYFSRVLLHGDILHSFRALDDAGQATLTDLGLCAEPTLDDFLLNLDLYRQHFPLIRHHTNPMRHFLGDDLSHFDVVARLDDMEHLRQAIARHTGQKVRIDRLQTSEHAVGFEDLDRPLQARLLSQTADEYAFLKGFYTAPRKLTPVSMQ